MLFDSSISFEFEPDNLSPTMGGELTGIIFLTIDGVAFPEEGWTDFVTVILKWWTDDLLTLWFSDKTERIQCRFMDGSPEFVVKKTGDGNWTIDCFDKNGISVLSARNLNPAVVLRSLHKTLRKVENAVHRQGFPTHTDLKDCAARLEYALSHNSAPHQK